MRRTVGIAIAIIVSMSCTRTAWSAALSCAEFKLRMDGALLATGSKDADSLSFKPGLTDPARGSRFRWSDSGLDGTLACGPADQFEEFGVNLAFVKKDDVAVGLRRFITLTGASVCALSSDSAPTCGEFARSMLQEGLEQMGQGFNHGSKTPAGTSDRTVLPGVKADLTSAPTLLTFLIGPDQGNTVEAARQPLAPPLSKPAE